MAEVEIIFRPTVEIQLTEDGGLEDSWNPAVGTHLQLSIGLRKINMDAIRDVLQHRKRVNLL